MQKISQLTEALLRHTHSFSLIKSDHILFTELHTDKVVTSRKERKYSNDLMIWLWGMCSCSFLRGCFGQTGTSTAKNISEMNILTSCVCVVLSHLFTGCDQRSHPLTRFIFLEVKVTVHQSPQYHKCLSTGHCDTSHHYWASQQFVASDKHHSHPLCGFRKHNLGKNMRKHAELWLSVWDKLQLKTWLIFIGIRDKVFVSCTRGFWLIKPKWLTVSCFFILKAKCTHH